MRILSLNTNPGFEDSALWQEHVTVVAALDSSWHSRSLVGKTLKLVAMARNFDLVLFYYDWRLAVVAGLLLRILVPSRRLVFQEFMPKLPAARDIRISVHLVRLWLHELLSRILVYLMNALIVHSSAEVNLYSEFYKTPKSRFVFVPYFYYEDSCGHAAGTNNHDDKPPVPIVLAAGRHRDYQCFMQAAAGACWNARIVAGVSDRDEIEKHVPATVATHYDVPRSEYRREIAEATVVVLPFYSTHSQRSLGQITMLEAMAMQRPVIAARTFQLADYASENEVLYYRAGDSDHLREQIDRLLADADLQKRLVRNAWERIHIEFTKDRHLVSLIDACQAVLDAQSTGDEMRDLDADTFRAAEP